MVADLVRLKLTLLRNSLRRSTGQLIGLILGGLYGLGVLGFLTVGLVLLGTADPHLIRSVLVIGGSAAVLGWMVIPVAAAGIDMTLDPARFVTFAVPMRQLLAGLTLGGLLGVPGVVTLVAALTQTATWIRYPAAAVVAPVCGLLAVVLCVVASRLVTTAISALAGTRRFKDVSGIVTIIPLVLLGPIIGGITAGFQNSPDFAVVLADVLAWTPLGALWAVPADIALGNSLQALLHFLVGVASIVLCLWLWSASLGRALVTPAYNSVTRKSGGNLGWFGRLPATPSAAVAARSLTYWVRDPRYSASLLTVPLIAVVLYFSGSQADSLAAFNFVGPITAFLLVWSISADISYDNTAFWLHLSTGVSGRADRAGRAGGLLLFGVPLALVFTVVPLVITGSLEHLPVMLGLSAGLLLTGTGLSSVVSARYTYNVPLPGESPFRTPPGTNFAMFGIQFVGWLVLLALALPEILLAVAYFITGNALFGWLSLAAGIALGAAALVLGIRVGGRWYDTRGPELLQAVSVNK
ncbi:hypothetical protein [Arthrobacter sp. Br18]|uniref:hypothetical protein n=1 Tax=Arthrobacter sp. Br18 TaxID=1312954 RepID=UPI00047B4D68|nr:hypothetical protein [Arthrobacter sp. Br18]